MKYIFMSERGEVWLLYPLVLDPILKSPVRQMSNLNEMTFIILQFCLGLPMSVLHCMTQMLLVLIKCREQVKVLHIIMKKTVEMLVSMFGWVMFVVMLFVIGNMLQDERVAMEYISELESAVEADGSLAADVADHCVEYHNIFGD